MSHVFCYTIWTAGGICIVYLGKRGTRMHYGKAGSVMLWAHTTYLNTPTWHWYSLMAVASFSSFQHLQKGLQSPYVNGSELFWHHKGGLHNTRQVVSLPACWSSLELIDGSWRNFRVVVLDHLNPVILIMTIHSVSESLYLCVDPERNTSAVSGSMPTH